MKKQKGIFNRKDQPGTTWGEQKTKRLTQSVTPTGWRLAKERAERLGITISELVERWARGYQVDTEDSQPIPPELQNNQVEGLTITELSQLIAARAEEEQEANKIKDDFILGLLSGTVSKADASEVSGVMELSDEQAEMLLKVVQAVKKERRTNGV
jgi:hypothetical protein